jgi:hypothetical protein
MRRASSAAAVAVMAVAGVLTLLAPSPASGQAYTDECTTLTGSQDLGSMTVGQTRTFRLTPTCTFTSGSTATVTVNGVSFTKPVTPGGSVDVTVNAVSNTLLEVNPQVPARCGPNTITAAAPSTVADGEIVTQTGTFNLVCAAATPTTVTPTTVTAVRTGVLARTGAALSSWGAAAVALVAMGGVLLAVGRRRAFGG